MIQVVRRSIVDVYSQYSFNRQSLAYGSQGQLYYLHNARFEPGKFAQAVMVEEGTTNLMNPYWSLTVDSNSDGIADGLGVLGSDPGIVATASVSSAGQKIEIVSGGSGAQGAWIAKSSRIAVVAGDKLSLQAEVQISGAVYGMIYLVWRDASLTQLGDVSNIWRSADIVNGRVKFENKVAPTNAVWADISFHTRRDGGVGYTIHKNVCIEKKAYCTSPHDGTRSSETLTIPTAGVLNPQEGTIEFFFLPTTPQASVPYGRVFSWGGGWTSDKSKNDMRIVWGSGSGVNKIKFEVVDKNTKTELIITAALSQNIQPGRLYYLAAKWVLPGYIKLTVYDFTTEQAVSVQDNFAYAPDFSTDGPAKLGVNVANTEHVNWLFDDLRISSRARTDEEIAAAYNSNAPLLVDADTTLKLDFDGPDAQRTAKVLIV